MVGKNDFEIFIVLSFKSRTCKGRNVSVSLIFSSQPQAKVRVKREAKKKSWTDKKRSERRRAAAARWVVSSLLLYIYTYARCAGRRTIKIQNFVLSR